MRTIHCLLALLLFQLSVMALERPPLPLGVKLIADQTFSEPTTGALTLDLYVPEKPSDKPIPILMWVHGGGWRVGSKEDCPMLWLVPEGYAVASINYRLFDVAIWPAQLDDCRNGVRWLRSNAEKFGLDPDRIAVGGDSAGGHLAAVLGTITPPADEVVSSRVRATIDFYGPTDLLTMPPDVPGPGRTDEKLAKTNEARLLGGIIRDIPEKAKAASALYLASADDAPFLILQGSDDPNVPLDQSVRLNEALKKIGVPSTLHVLDGVKHGGPAFDTDAVKNVIRTFLDQHVRN